MRSPQKAAPPPPANDLRKFFDARTQGHGIWKWLHYFDIYEEHFKSFRGKEVHILEVGIYSGGSLDMWREYFGPECHVYGVDNAPDCKAYERDGVKVFIGDQADRAFWKRFRSQVPKLDIVVDDGGHEYEQQAVTVEELLPHIRPGGVYLCEDIHNSFNLFSSFVSGLVHKLNSFEGHRWNETDPDRRLSCPTSPFQAQTASIHCYPYAVVIKKRDTPLNELLCPKHGTQWQPHLT